MTVGGREVYVREEIQSARIFVLILGRVGGVGNQIYAVVVRKRGYVWYGGGGDDSCRG